MSNKNLTQGGLFFLCAYLMKLIKFVKNQYLVIKDLL